MSTMLDKFLGLISPQVDVSIYVWGAQGEKLSSSTVSPEWIRKKYASQRKVSAKQREENIQKAIALYKKRKMIEGSRAFDCSGLICWALVECGAYKALDVTADQLYKDYTDPIEKKDLRAGDLVFRVSDGEASHVGVYFGSGKTDEARSSAYGVVQTELEGRGWNRFGRLKVFKNEPAPAPAPKPSTGGTCEVTIKIIKKGIKGEAVRTLQTLLKALGYKGADKKVLSVDGECGSNTEAAIKAFQKAKGLSDDGVCGSKTWDKIING